MDLPKTSISQHLVNISNHFFLHVGMLFVVVALFKAEPFPSVNEMFYLLLPRLQYDRTYFLNDFMLSEPWYSHYVFNLLIGPLTLVFPLDIIGWLGRIVCWTLILITLLRLGLKLQIPLWMGSLAILLWLMYGPGLVASEEILAAGLEAKRIAYIFLFFALKALINKHDVAASILLGLTFSFHPSVGLFSILSVGLSLLVLRYPFGKLVKIVVLTALFSAPGIIPLIPSTFGSDGLSPQHLKFLTLISMPHHLNPFSWTRRAILFPYLLLLFNWIHFRMNRENEAVKFCMYFQIFLGLFFSIGILCRFTETYAYLIFFPFRLFPSMTLLFFFFHLMHAYRYRASKTPDPAIIAIGFIALLSFGSPFEQFVDRARFNYRMWTEVVPKLKNDDVASTFTWIAKNTPTGAIAILPPWRQDSWYATQRAQVACYRFPPYDNRIAEWLERVQLLIGKIEATPTTYEDFEKYYNRLTESEIASISRKYGGEYLVSKGTYTYPILFDSGTYKVYGLNGNDKELR